MSAAALRDRRALAGLAAIALAAVILVVFVLPGGSGSVAPATGAARLVPADALAYVHVSTDPDRPQTTRALTLLERFPSFAALRTRLIGSLGRFGRGTGVDFGRDIRPWLGDEAALALLNTQSEVAAAVFVLDVRSKAKAREFLQRLGAPAASATYHGTTIDVYGDQAAAFVSHYLVAGPLAGVRAAIDAHRAPDSSLARSPGYVRAASGEPDDRVIDAYASDAGVTRVLAPQTGALGVAGTLLRQPGLEGVGLSLRARHDTFTLRIHSSLVGGSQGSTGGLPLRPFKPTLAGAVPGPALAFANLGGLDRALPRLLAAGSVGRTLTGVQTSLRRAGVDLQRDVVGPLLSGEVAATLLPDASAVPVLLVVARTKDQAGAREAMAKLQPAMTRLLGAAAGGPPLTGFTERDIDGVTAYELRAGPTLELDYAVRDGEVAVATSLDAIAALHAGRHPLADDGAFRATRGTQDGDVTSLTFLDLSQLLDLAEDTGLRNDPQYRQVREDLRTVRAVGLQTASGEAESTAEISLQIR